MTETTMTNKTAGVISDLTCTINGTVAVGGRGGGTVQVSREASFTRAPDGGWLVCLYRVDPEARALIERGLVDPVSASLEIHEPAVNTFLDRLMALLANPTGEQETIGMVPSEETA